VPEEQEWQRWPDAIFPADDFAEKAEKSFSVFLFPHFGHGTFSDFLNISRSNFSPHFLH
jgi:hypothetical protein